METQQAINDLINKIASGDNTGAQTDFNALIAAKVQDAIEVKKVELAQSVYGTPAAEVETEQETEDEPNSENA